MNESEREQRQADAELARALAAAAQEEAETALSPWHPASFDSRWVNLLAPPLVVGLAVVLKQTFFGFLLTGFHVWIHEFGHATVAWLTGHRALPLPIGWTPVGEEKSTFVYFGVLFLLGVLAVAGWRERKPWAIVIAATLAVVQAAMTWVLPAETARMWTAFAGVGGEFYLSAAMIGLFYFELPEKFRWGACRYFFLFIGGASFFESFTFWRRVKRGEEGIPYGTMIQGEEDAGGDMNVLHEDFDWTQRQIIHTYNHLADACLAVLIVLYLVFALRLDRLPAIWWERWQARSAPMDPAPGG